MVSEVVHRHLMAARQELLQQRNAIDAEIQEIDRMLGQRARNEFAHGVSSASMPTKYALAGETPPRGLPRVARVDEVPLEQVSTLIGGGASIEEAVIGVLNLTRTPMKTEDIVHLLAVGSDWEPSSIRSQLARSFKDGKIERLRRGVYAALEDDSAPTEAGAESRVQHSLDLEGGAPSREQDQEDHGDGQA